MPNHYLVDGKKVSEGEMTPSEVGIPHRRGFTSSWKELGTSDAFTTYEAVYSPLADYLDEVHFAKYMVGEHLAYCLPFTISTGIPMGMPVGHGIPEQLCWGYTPLEARDLVVKATTDMESIKRARRFSSHGHWIRELSRISPFSKTLFAPRVLKWRTGYPDEPFKGWYLGEDQCLIDRSIDLGNGPIRLDALEYLAKYNSHPLMSGADLDRIGRTALYECIFGTGGGRIAFIGEPGKGKTTAICNWLGLLKTDKDNLESMGSALLLQTSSGRTTAFEVSLRSTDGPSTAIIEPYSYSEQVNLIRRFAELCMIDLSDEERDIIDTIPIELQRMICNMAGFDGFATMKPYMNEDIKGLAGPDGTADDLAAALVQKIMLGSRVTTVFTYKNEEPFDEWLATKFRNLNEGTEAGAPIPSRVLLEISRRDLKLSCDGAFSEVIDTIGLDTANPPERIRSLMKSPDTICILTDDLQQCPSRKIIDLLKSTFKPEETEDLRRIGILVKSSLEGLGSVNECEGDLELAKRLKIREIEQKFAREGIQFPMENIEFLDSCQAYSTRKTKTKVLDPNGEPILNEYGLPMYRISEKIQFDEDFAMEYEESFSRFLNRIQHKLTPECV